MTLRRRLLLVYLIVVLLSVATVGAAMFELSHARQIIRHLQDWNKIVLNVQKLQTVFPPSAADPSPINLLDVIAEQFAYLTGAPADLDVNQVREGLTEVYREYSDWLDEEVPAERSRKTHAVTASIEDLSHILEGELSKLNTEADRQEVRAHVLLAAVIVLTVIHVAVVGSLLRRWLLHPMERLNRQVSALARDEPPPEPILTQPREMANLARALDEARRSLGALRQKLIDAERLTTIGQFAAQLAHNLRNPLASIRANAQLAARKQKATGETPAPHTGGTPVPHPTGETPVPHLTGDTPVPHAADRMQEIIASVDRMNQWIAGLMEVAQQEPTAARALDVRPTLQRVREAVAPELAAKELSLEVDVPSDPLLCAHDPATLEHALIAITVNAIEASPLGGRIELHAEPVHRRDAGATDGRDRACRIAVLDSGPGLPPDAPDRIFEFSYSTKQEGMGLGLALARLALQRRGATTGAVNRPEGGAEVFIEIPLDQAGPRDSETAGQRDSAPPPESRRPTIPLSLRPESAIRNSQSAIPEDLYAQDPDRRG